MNIQPCLHCGQSPTLKEQHFSGHGEGGSTWYVVCQCGIRTKAIYQGYEGTEDECKYKALAIWNNR